MICHLYFASQLIVLTNEVNIAQCEQILIIWIARACFMATESCVHSLKCKNCSNFQTFTLSFSDRPIYFFHHKCNQAIEFDSVTRVLYNQQDEAQNAIGKSIILTIHLLFCIPFIHINLHVKIFYSLISFLSQMMHIKDI